MNSHYPSEIAQHYAAYRPPLHAPILGMSLPQPSQFQKGLDVGCGTGYSCLALLAYCTEVTGLDPQESMLQEAITHPYISYVTGTTEELPFGPDTFDIVTFGGSLVYAYAPDLPDKLREVCKADATILVYDFEVKLEEWYEELGIKPLTPLLPYDHALNFADNEDPDLEEEDVGYETLGLEVDARQLAHLLLASHEHYPVLAEKYGLSDPFEGLIEELGEYEMEWPEELEVAVYWSRYVLRG